MAVRKNFHKRTYPKKQEERFRVNEKIIASQVRLVGEGVVPGIYERGEALRIAREKGLDLIEISSKGDPPVCKVMDFSKFRFEQKKVSRAKERTNRALLKTIRIAPNIGVHDFSFKERHAKDFLSRGAHVRIEVFFKRPRDFYGYRERAEEQLKKMVASLEECKGKMKHPIKLLGRQMFTIIEPTKG